MKYGIFSDIHGHINLLEKLTDKFKEEKVDKGICLGDIVHNANSFDENRCITLMRENKYYSLRGNHDIEATETYDESKFFEENIDYLRKLPRMIQLGDILFFHNSLGDEFNIEREFEALKRNEAKIGFFGHNHKRVIYRKREFIEELDNDRFYFGSGLYLINPGALWKEGRYGIYHVTKHFFEFKQLS